MRRFALALLACALAAPALAQITVGGSSSSITPGTGGSITVARPAGTQAGDVLIAQVVVRGGSNVNMLAVPAGWTQVARSNNGNTIAQFAYRRTVVAAGEPASYLWDYNGNRDAAAAITVFRGVDTVTPVDASGAQTASSATVTAPAVTTTVVNTRLVALFAAANGNVGFTPQASLAEAVEVGNGAGANGVALSTASEARAATGGTGTRTAALSSSQINSGILLALRPLPVLAGFRVEAAGGGTIPSQVAGSPFAIRITAIDANGNTVAGFTGTVTISSTGTLTQGAGATASFVNGVLASHTVTISDTGSFTITATGSGVSGTSNAFTVTTLSAFVLAEYRSDETLWNGTAGDVLDASGNGYHGRSVNAVTANATPAIAGSPGTCGYGVFNRSNAYIEMPAAFPNLTGSFTVVTWIRPTVDLNGHQRIFGDDENNTGGYGFSLGDGGSGRLRFFSRSVSPISLDTGAIINALNTWYFVAAVHDAAARTRTIYAFNAAGTLLGSATGTYTGTWGSDAGRASFGGETAGGGSEAVPQWRFGGNIDELKVYSRALTQAQVASLLPITRPCSGVAAPPGAFNAFDTSTAAGAITGPIRTKVAGSAFSLAVIALNGARNAVLTTFTGTVTVELLNAADNSGALDAATSCRSTWTPIQTVSPNPVFAAASNGRINVAFTRTTPGATCACA